MKSFRRLLFSFLIILTIYDYSSVTAETPHDRFIVITPQKTGTHLLLPILKNMLGKGWRSTHGNFNSKRLKQILEDSENDHVIPHIHAEPKQHIINTLKRNKYKVLFIWRDPRDQVLSMLYRVIWGRVYGPLNMSSEFGNLSFDEQLHEVITGKRFGISVTRDMMVNRIPWLYQDPEFVYVIHFENLVGEEGGGSRDLQLQEITSIAKHLNVPLSSKEISDCTIGVFGNSGNFRSGQIGDWKTHFSREHKQIFKDLFGDILIQTGYEKNYNW